MAVARLNASTCILSAGSSKVELPRAVGVLMRERGELMFSREPDLAAVDKKSLKASELRESRDAAVHLSISEVEVLKLSEVLEEGQAVIHLSIVEIEVLKLGEVLNACICRVLFCHQKKVC